METVEVSKILLLITVGLVFIALYAKHSVRERLLKTISDQSELLDEVRAAAIVLEARVIAANSEIEALTDRVELLRLKLKNEKEPKQ